MRNAEKKLPATKSGRHILDASAVLALFRGERGSDVVLSVLTTAEIHAVNVAEVVKKLAELGVPDREIRQSFDELQVPVIESVSVPQAIAVGKLAAAGRKYGLSLGDCVCLATAITTGVTAVTSDRRWAEAHELGADALLIR